MDRDIKKFRIIYVASGVIIAISELVGWFLIYRGGIA